VTIMVMIMYSWPQDLWVLQSVIKLDWAPYSDPTTPSDSQWPSIFGRLCTRRLCTVVLLYHQ
jgi:hypothetical protein